jgi:hypothetical protein
MVVRYAGPGGNIVTRGTEALIEAGADVISGVGAGSICTTAQAGIGVLKLRPSPLAPG